MKDSKEYEHPMEKSWHVCLVFMKGLKPKSTAGHNYNILSRNPNSLEQIRTSIRGLDRRPRVLHLP